MQRGSGVLLAVSSLPGKYGIGTLGKNALDFIDCLSKAGQKYWQILPLSETGYGGSPYQSISAFAGNINYIDFDELFSCGLLSREELLKCEKAFKNSELADLDGQSVKLELLRPAFLRGRADPETEAFRDRNKHWIDDYALFRAIDKNDGWTPALLSRDMRALKEAEDEYRDDKDLFIFLQYIFWKQWKKVREYANSQGIAIIGDMPIYVSADGADVWAHPDWFKKDEISGCPPDAFSSEGQKWGNPIFDWQALEQNGYGFFIQRFDQAFELYDYVRVDHFRGFEAYWNIPKDGDAKDGHWEKGPGMKLFGMLKEWFGRLPVIAEDLGTLTPSFFEFMDKCGFPGMRVLQFAFAPYENSIYLPHNLTKNSIVYTGTHDNDTTLSWYKKLPAAEKAYLHAYIGECGEENICEKLCDTAMASVCDVCVLPMQDILNEGGGYRMNMPGTVGGINWRYRLKKELFNDEIQKRLLEKTKIYGR